MSRKKSPYAYMRPATRKKFERIAAKDGRSMVETYDRIADAELERRGMTRRPRVEQKLAG